MLYANIDVMSELSLLNSLKTDDLLDPLELPAKFYRQVKCDCFSTTTAKEVYFSDNRISHLSLSPSQTTNSLERLDVSRNQLTSVSSLYRR